MDVSTILDRSDKSGSRLGDEFAPTGASVDLALVLQEVRIPSAWKAHEVLDYLDLGGYRSDLARMINVEGGYYACFQVDMINEHSMWCECLEEDVVLVYHVLGENPYHQAKRVCAVIEEGIASGKCLDVSLHIPREWIQKRGQLVTVETPKGWSRSTTKRWMDAHGYICGRGSQHPQEIFGSVGYVAVKANGVLLGYSVV